MKILLKPFLFIFVFLLLTSCSLTKYVFKSNFYDVLNKSSSTWTIKECKEIIQHYSLSTGKSNIFSTKTDVKIEALPLNKTVVLVLARKEAIEKRLNNQEYKNRLKDLLEAYTSFTIDTISMKVIPSESNFTNGYSFKLYLENTTDPFRPIFLDDGYSYFFLENKEGKFSRIIEVTGLYAEDYIQLDSYLNVVVTFSPFATDGTRLFKNKDLSEAYKLVFNGLQDKPITLEWK